MTLADLQRQLVAQAEQVSTLQSSLENVQRQLLEQKRSSDRSSTRIESLVNRIGTLETRCGTHEGRTLLLEEDRDGYKSDASAKEVKLSVQRLEARMQLLEQLSASAAGPRDNAPPTDGLVAPHSTTSPSDDTRSRTSAFVTPQSRTPRSSNDSSSSYENPATPLHKVPGLTGTPSPANSPFGVPQPSIKAPAASSGFSTWSKKAPASLDSGCSKSTFTVHAAALPSPSANAFSTLAASGSSVFGPSSQPDGSSATVPTLFVARGSKGTGDSATPRSSSLNDPSVTSAPAQGEDRELPPSSDGLSKVMAAFPSLSASEGSTNAALQTQPPKKTRSRVPSGSAQTQTTQSLAAVTKSLAAKQGEARTISRSSRSGSKVATFSDDTPAAAEQSLARLRELSASKTRVAAAPRTTGTDDDVEMASTTATPGSNTPVGGWRLELPSESTSKEGRGEVAKEAEKPQPGPAAPSVPIAKPAAASRKPTSGSAVASLAAQPAPPPASTAAPALASAPADAAAAVPIPSDNPSDAQPQPPVEKEADQTMTPSEAGEQDEFAITSVNLKPAKKSSSKSAMQRVTIKTEKGTEKPAAPAAATSGASSSSTGVAASAAAVPSEPRADRAVGSEQLQTAPPKAAAVPASQAPTQPTRTQPSRTKAAKPPQPPAQTEKGPSQAHSADALASQQPRTSEAAPQPSAQPQESCGNTANISSTPGTGSASAAPLPAAPAPTAPAPTRPKLITVGPNVHCAETALGPALAGQSALMEYAAFSEALQGQNPQFAVALLNGRRLLVRLDVSWARSGFCASLLPDLDKMRRGGTKYRTSYSDIDDAWSFPLYLRGTSIETLDNLPTDVAKGSEDRRPAMALDAIRNLRYKGTCSIDVRAMSFSPQVMSHWGVGGGIVLGADFLLRAPWRARLRISRLERYTLHHFYFSTRHDEWAFACFSRPEMATKFGYPSRVFEDELTTPTAAASKRVRTSDSIGSDATPAASSSSAAQLPFDPSTHATEARPVISVLGQGQRIEEREMAMVTAVSSHGPSTSSRPETIPTAPAADHADSQSRSKTLAERLAHGARALPPRPMSRSASAQSSTSSSSVVHACGGAGQKRKVGSLGALGDRISGHASVSPSPSVDGDVRRPSPGGASPHKRPRPS